VGSRDGASSTQEEVYVICLDCGRRFAYDWNTMQIKKAQGAGIRLPGKLEFR
jgi:hypothetical protein